MQGRVSFPGVCIQWLQSGGNEGLAALSQGKTPLKGSAEAFAAITLGFIFLLLPASTFFTPLTDVDPKDTLQ